MCFFVMTNEVSPPHKVVQSIQSISADLACVAVSLQSQEGTVHVDSDGTAIQDRQLSLGHFP